MYQIQGVVNKVSNRSIFSMFNVFSKTLFNCMQNGIRLTIVSLSAPERCCGQHPHHPLLGLASSHSLCWSPHLKKIQESCNTSDSLLSLQLCLCWSRVGADSLLFPAGAVHRDYQRFIREARSLVWNHGAGLSLQCSHFRSFVHDCFLDQKIL